ncbi:MAG: penicillin-binding protein activator [Methyloceanibacter sp.]|jgi:branched-chain amino acid transport system substrate-binding protein|nr:penicillin-binding protein activator [Methyloceanibacter sp.]
MRSTFSIDHHLGAIRLLLATLAVAALLTACGGGGGGPGSPGITGSTGSVKVALLLPITASGATPAIAKALKQAAELALFDFDNPNVTLVPKDTRGTPDGARAAAESAVRDGAELIIGPLFAQEVTGAAPVARQAGIPMIAFSSDEKVAGNGVYLLSFLAGRDVPRIVSFAMSRGKRSFAELVPQSPYGRIAEAAFGRAVSAGSGQIAVNAAFPPDDSNAMLGPVRQVGNAIKGGQPVDALFVPAGRDELPSLAPLLASADLTSARVQFIGTGQWDYPNIGSEKALVGGWYPAPDPKGWSGFTQRYAKTYGAVPPRLASLAYDAVSLAVSLSQNPQGERYASAQLTRSSGFAGIDGLFRLLPDGTCERGLAILEVREGGPVVIDPAPSSFATASSY